MGYNLKNARIGKSASKIPKWPSLRLLAVKSKFIRQFEFSDNLEDLYGKCGWRARPFLVQIFLFFKKIETVMISHSLMVGALNLAILVFR